MDGYANEAEMHRYFNTFIRQMVFVEQFVYSVIDYSSRYNSSISISYAPENLVGKPSRYPFSGDYADTYTMRTYGSWWSKSKFAQADYMPQDPDPMGAEDYVTITFETAVVPKNVMIYETFHPGSIVRIWGKDVDDIWYLMYEAPNNVPSKPTAKRFEPEIKQVFKLIDTLRLEINQKPLDYHTALDAVLLAGYRVKTMLQMWILHRGMLFHHFKKSSDCDNLALKSNVCTTNYISSLPYEVLVHIFSYLDLKSLARCARVNKTWNDIIKDPEIYQQISLKKYWYTLKSSTLWHLKSRCRRIKKLDMSWCGVDKTISEDAFIAFLEESAKHLTHLACNNCIFLNSAAVSQISNATNLIELRINQCKSQSGFSALANLTKLKILEVALSNIGDEDLIEIVIANKQLQHDNIDLCEQLRRLDEITELLGTHKILESFSAWKTYTMTPTGIGYLANCPNLKELDLGWCLLVAHPEECLKKFAMQCPKLSKLILCGWRGVSDSILLPIVTHCKELEMLDLVGMLDITAETCKIALESLPKLQLLDISFCESISNVEVMHWREFYPNVKIQRCCFNET